MATNDVNLKYLFSKIAGFQFFPFILIVFFFVLFLVNLFVCFACKKHARDTLLKESQK